MIELTYNFKRLGKYRGLPWVSCYYVNPFENTMGVYAISSTDEPDRCHRVGESNNLLRRAYDHLALFNRVGLKFYSRKWSTWIDTVDQIYHKGNALILTVLEAGMECRYKRLQRERYWTQRLLAEGHPLLNKDGRPHHLR
jgi:hypothetical protein